MMFVYLFANRSMLAAGRFAWDQLLLPHRRCFGTVQKGQEWAGKRNVSWLQNRHKMCHHRERNRESTENPGQYVQGYTCEQYQVPHVTISRIHRLAMTGFRIHAPPPASHLGSCCLNSAQRYDQIWASKVSASTMSLTHRTYTLTRRRNISVVAYPSAGISPDRAVQRQQDRWTDRPPAKICGAGGDDVMAMWQTHARRSCREILVVGKIHVRI